MSDDLHPDYLAADVVHRWTGQLLQLAITAREKAWKAKGEWVWWVMPRGACVAMRVNPESFIKELRLSRRERPTDEKGWAAWRVEVATFIQHLEASEWRLHKQSDPYDGAPSLEAVFIEPAPLGSKGPQTVDCAGGCGRKLIPEGIYKEELCNDCATRKGRQESLGEDLL